MLEIMTSIVMSIGDTSATNVSGNVSVSIGVMSMNASATGTAIMIGAMIRLREKIRRDGSMGRRKAGAIAMCRRDRRKSRAVPSSMTIIT